MGRRREAFEEPHGRNVRGPKGTVDQQEKNQAENPKELIEAAVSTVQVVLSQYSPSERLSRTAVVCLSRTLSDSMGI